MDIALHVQQTAKIVVVNSNPYSLPLLDYRSGMQPTILFIRFAVCTVYCILHTIFVWMSNVCNIAMYSYGLLFLM